MDEVSTTCVSRWDKEAPNQWLMRMVRVFLMGNLDRIHMIERGIPIVLILLIL